MGVTIGAWPGTDGNSTQDGAGIKFGAQEIVNTGTEEGSITSDALVTFTSFAVHCIPAFDFLWKM